MGKFYCQNPKDFWYIILAVYLVMILGNVLLTTSLNIPEQLFMMTLDLNGYYIVLWIWYQILWFLMLWSHLATMCREPGFIPLEYEYDTDLLSIELYKYLYNEQFKNFDAEELFMGNKRNKSNLS